MFVLCRGALAASLFVLCDFTSAQAGTQLHGIPGDLEARNTPFSWNVNQNEALTITAQGKTNWFVSPSNLKSWDSAPTLLFRPDEDFILSANVSLRPRSRWDSGALVLFVNNTTWAKFCLESADGPSGLSVVSVVTNGVSDDSYSIAAPGESLYMKVAKFGPTFAFYASADGHSWKMIRTFRLGDREGVKVGFLSQSPTGTGLTATFSEIRYSPTRISNLFTGD